MKKHQKLIACGNFIAVVALLALFISQIHNKNGSIENFNQFEAILNSSAERLAALELHQKELRALSESLKSDADSLEAKIANNPESANDAKKAAKSVASNQSKISQSIVALSASIGQFSESQNRINEILKKVKVDSEIVYRKEISAKFLEKAEDSSVDYEKRNVLYLLAITHALDKDVALIKYINFVENQIARLENKDDAMDLYETLVSKKNDFLADGTPENVMDAEKYEKRIAEIFENNKEKLTPLNSDEALSNSLKEELDNILSVDDENAKFRALNIFTQKCESEELQYRLEHKPIPETLIEAFNNAKIQIEKIAKNKAAEQEKLSKEYQRKALKNIYAFRKYCNGTGKITTRNDAKNFLSEVKSKLLWIDLGHTNQSVMRLYQQEYENAYKKLKNAKQIDGYDPIKELAIAEIETKKLSPFE